MIIDLHTYELKVGDVWNGKRIVHIEAPPEKPLEWSYIIHFEDGQRESSRAQSHWEVARKIERITE